MMLIEKKSALSSGKIDNYKYLTGEEILPSDQSRILEQAKSTYSSPGKAFEKQTEKTEALNKKRLYILKKSKRETLYIFLLRYIN